MIAPASRPASVIARKDRRRARLWRDVAFVCVLGLISAIALGANSLATFPAGDGGLFYRIVERILAGDFSLPRLISYNGTNVPFTYSPLAFYGVAAIVKVTSVDISRAMVWWVACFDMAIAPAAFYAAHRFLQGRRAALVTAAVLVVFPVNAAWLGMGGAVTRAPGYVAFLFACGAAWSAMRDRRRRETVVAIVVGTALAWIHMEFFFLFVLSLGVLVAFDLRSRLKPGLVILAAVGAGSLPWVVFSHHDLGAFSNALETRHFGSNVVPIGPFAHYWGIGLHGDWLPLLGLTCTAITLIFRRYDYAVWTIAIIALDTRAGVQAAHLPTALAIGWCFERLDRILWVNAQRRFTMRVALAGALLAAIGLTQEDATFYRLEPSDVAMFRWMHAHTPPKSTIFTLSPLSLDEAGLDQTFEWLPVFAERRSPITYQGLEWVSGRAFAERAADYYSFEAQCVRSGGSCVRKYARELAPGTPSFLYVPAHGPNYPLVVAAMARDARLRIVHEGDGGSIFAI